jgi:hypothetical protein
MKTDLAIHGGKPIVPESLKKRWPEITVEDKAAVMAVLDREILTGVHGPEAKALEREWADFAGSKHAVSFNSGTAAIAPIVHPRGGLFQIPKKIPIIPAASLGVVAAQGHPGILAWGRGRRE